MSMHSVFQTDQSELLCKRFASLASSYLEQQEPVRAPETRVPLENLFRLLEMLRFGAFADENRKGVLAIEPIQDRQPYRASASWHSRIENAMKSSLAESFTAVPIDRALDQLEETLRWLAIDAKRPDDPTVTNARLFFSRLAAKLP